MIATVCHAARSTLDVDVVAELDQRSATSLVESLRGQYYVSDAAVRDAIRLRSCFNLIHLATSFKIDMFVNKGRAFDASALERAVVDRLVTDDSSLARIATAEDVILAKLEWYRLGGEVSERQWRDVTVVAKLQGPRLDWDYMSRFAAELGVVGLLGRLRAEALE